MAISNVFNFGIGLSFRDEDLKQTLEGLDGIAKAADFMGNTLKKVGSTLDFTSLVPDTALDLQDAVARIAAETTGLDKTARATSDAIFDMAVNEGFATSSSRELATALAETGQSITDVGSRKALGALVDLFGVSGEEAAQLSAGIAILGDDLDSVAARTAAVQKRLGVTGGFSVLSEAVRGSREAIVSFGKSVVGSGPEIMKTIQRVAAVTQKSLGVGAAAAISLAQASFNAFSGELLTARRYLIGLSGDAGPAISALYELGDGFDEARRRLKEGQRDPINFVRRILDETSRIDEIQAARVIEQLVDAFQGTPIANYLRNTEALNRAIAAQAEAQADRDAGFKTFDKVVEDLQSTGRGALKVFDALLSVVGDAFGVIISEITGKSMKDVNSIVRFLVGSLNDFRENVVNSEVFTKKFIPVLKTIGTVSIFAGKAVGVLASGVLAFKSATMFLRAGAEVRALDHFKKAFDWLRDSRFIKPIVEFFKKLRSRQGLQGFGRSLLKYLPVIGNVYRAFVALRDAGKTMFEVFLDKSATSGDRFLGFVRSIGAGAVGLIDAVFLGIPSMVARAFFGVEDSLGMAFGRFLKGPFKSLAGREMSDMVHDLIVGAGKVVLGGLKDLVVGFYSFLTGEAPKATGSFLRQLGADIALGLTGVLGGLGMFFFDTLPEVIVGLGKVVATIGTALGEAAGDAFMSGLKSAAMSEKDSWLHWFGSWIPGFSQMKEDFEKLSKALPARDKGLAEAAKALTKEGKAKLKALGYEKDITKERQKQFDLSKAAAVKREKTLEQQCKELAEREREQALLRRVKLGIESPGLVDSAPIATMSAPQLPRDRGEATTAAPRPLVRVEAVTTGDSKTVELGTRTIKLLATGIAKEGAKPKYQIDRPPSTANLGPFAPPAAPIRPSADVFRMIE